MNGGNDEFTSPVFSRETLMRAIINPYGKRVIVNGVPAERPGLEESKTSKAESIKGAIFVISFIGAIIAMAVFAQTEPMLCVATLGAVILVIGLANLFQNGVSLEEIMNLVFPLIGAVLVAIPAVNVYHKSHPDSFYFSKSEIIDVVCIGFMMIGAGLLFIPPVVRSQKMKTCTQVISAMCIYRNTHQATSKRANGRTRRYDLYAPWWQYEVNGMIYVTRENTFTDEDVPQIGDIREIRFSPDEPAEIYRPLLVKKFVPAFIGAMFVVIPALTMVVMHKR